MGKTRCSIDSQLLKSALEAGGHTSAEDLVAEALAEYVQRKKTERQKQMQIIDLFGTVDFAEGYEYKANRRR